VGAMVHLGKNIGGKKWFNHAIKISGGADEGKGTEHGERGNLKVQEYKRRLWERWTRLKKKKKIEGGHEGDQARRRMNGRDPESHKENKKGPTPRYGIAHRPRKRKRAVKKGERA